MHIAVNLCAQAGLSTDRVPIRRLSPCPPWRRSPTPSILLTLKGQEGATTRRIPPATLRAMAVDTIQSFPSDAIVCYTDGSAMKGPDRAGYGALIEYPSRLDPDRIAGSCGLATCVFDAEAIGITRALDQVTHRLREKQTVTTTVVVVCDSQSVLQAMNGLGTLPKTIEEAISAADEICWLFGAVIVMQ